MKLVMNGALGRMGRSIITVASEDPDIEVIGAVDLNQEQYGQDIGEILGIGFLGTTIVNNLSGVISDADVVVDFSMPDVAMKTAELCGKTKTPLVEGTTGLTPEMENEFKTLIAPVPCVKAPNMSIGVNLLFMLSALTASKLGIEYDVEISEVHHRFKKDSPSGTARRLYEIIADILGSNLGENVVYGREGIIGERPKNEIGIHALRTGDVVGEHTVTFGTIGERVELVHKAHSRDSFAHGALRAAKFVCQAEPGLYDMQDVLGLRY